MYRIYNTLCFQAVKYRITTVALVTCSINIISISEIRLILPLFICKLWNGLKKSLAYKQNDENKGRDISNATNSDSNEESSEDIRRNVVSEQDTNTILKVPGMIKGYNPRILSNISLLTS